MGAVLEHFPSKKTVQGLKIKSMLKESKLRSYGLKENDIILTIDGTAVTKLLNLSEALTKNPGKIEILRPLTLE